MPTFITFGRCIFKDIFFKNLKIKIGFLYYLTIAKSKVIHRDSISK